MATDPTDPVSSSSSTSPSSILQVTRYTYDAWGRLCAVVREKPAVAFYEPNEDPSKPPTPQAQAHAPAVYLVLEETVEFRLTGAETQESVLSLDNITVRTWGHSGFFSQRTPFLAARPRRSTPAAGWGRPGRFPASGENSLGKEKGTRNADLFSGLAIAAGVNNE